MYANEDRKNTEERKHCFTTAKEDHVSREEVIRPLLQDSKHITLTKNAALVCRSLNSVPVWCISNDKLTDPKRKPNFVKIKDRYYKLVNAMKWEDTFNLNICNLPAYSTTQ